MSSVRNASVDVVINHTEDLSQVNIDILSINGDPLSGQEILDAVAETLLLRWDHYDLTSETRLDS